jgi:hypothetical protein
VIELKRLLGDLKKQDHLYMVVDEVTSGLYVSENFDDPVWRCSLWM